MANPIELEPGESVLVGHEAGTVSLVEGESVTVSAIPEPVPPPLPTALQVFVIDPLTDERGAQVNTGDTIPKPFALEVVPIIPGVASVRCSRDGTVLRIENNAPFAPFGDTSGDFAAADVPAGGMTLRFEAFSAKNATGTLLSDRQLIVNVTTATTPPPDPPDPPDPPGGDEWALIPAEVRQWITPASGWTVTGLDLFDTDIDQGDWGRPGGQYAYPGMTEGDWLWRPTAYANTGTDSSKRGHYSGKDTTWIRDGEMFEHIRFGKKDVLPFRHDPTGVPLVNRPLLVGPGRTPSLQDTTRRYAWDICLYAKYPGGFIASFKCAHLLWAHSTIGTVGYAEYNMPEFKFGDGLRGNGFAHNEDTVGGQDAVRLNLDTTKFHLFRMRFQAQGYKGHPTGIVEMWVDGVKVLTKTSNITGRDMYYAKQTETYLKRDKIAGEDGGPPLNAQGPQGIITTRLFQIAELA